MENCLFIHLRNNAGCGDLFFYTILGIRLLKKYNRIYIYHGAKNFYHIKDELMLLLNSNKASNVFCINHYANVKEYYDIFEKDNFDTKNICKVDGNYYFDLNHYLFEYKENDYHDFIYISTLKKFGLSIPDFYDVNFDYYEQIDSICNELYNLLISRIGINYILVFDNLERSQSLFTFRHYRYEVNPNRYKVVFMNKQDFYYEDEYYIGNILNNSYKLLFFKKIVKCAKEAHFMNSYPAHFFNLLFHIYSNDFQDVKKVIYMRNSFYRTNSDCNYNINSKYIDTIDELTLFYKFYMYSSILFYKYNYHPKIFEDGLDYIVGGHKRLNGNSIIYEGIKPSVIDCFRLLQCNASFTRRGYILHHNMNTINIIELSNLDISNNYDLNIKKGMINVLLLKSENTSFTIIPPRELNSNRPEIKHENFKIQQVDRKIFNFIEYIIKLKELDYIFVYKHDLDIPFKK